MTRQGTVPRTRRRRAAGVFAAIALAAALGAPAFAKAGWQGQYGPGELILAGHNPDIPAAVKRVIGRVTAVGAPNETGAIYSFEVDIADLAINELRSWRLTFVSGALYAYVFQVRSNEGAMVTVTSIDGPLNGIAVGDGFLIEEIPVSRPVPQMRQPPAV